VQKLLEYHDDQVSALEIGLSPGSDVSEIEQQVQNIVGSAFRVQDRYQQKEFFYKIMKSEKWAIFFILSFILIVASFNVIGSLTMLILDKKDDIATLRSLGINIPSLRKIFLLEGWMISLFGAIIGLALGGLVCWIQLRFQIIQLQGSGSFVIDAYPVAMKISDFIMIFFTVFAIGFVAAWYPVRFINRRFINRSEKLSLQ
jgi:lipoprotein-releasing system permease protein